MVHRGLSFLYMTLLCPVSVRKSYVEFDDKDKGPIPNGWIHKMVKHETDNGNESNLSNNNS